MEYVCKTNFLITINIVFGLSNCTTIQQIAHKCKIIIIIIISQNKVIYIHIIAVYAMKIDEVASSSSSHICLKFHCTVTMKFVTLNSKLANHPEFSKRLATNHGFKLPIIIIHTNSCWIFGF
jgi:hypothetical protein